MTDYERICVLDSDAQAGLLEAMLKEKGVPHVMRSYHDSAYDGLFQGSQGWGHVEAPEEYREQILGILDALGTDPAPEA